MLVAADLEQPRSFSFLGGEVVAFTRPCPGVDGRTNEDACAIFPWDGKSGVLVVADGVGGLPAGGDAARITIRAIRDAARAMFGEGTFLPLTEGMPGAEVDACLARFADG